MDEQLTESANCCNSRYDELMMEQTQFHNRTLHIQLALDAIRTLTPLIAHRNDLGDKVSAKIVELIKVVEIPKVG